MRIVSTIVMILIAATSVLAVCADPAPKVCSAYFAYDAAFVATVLSKHDVDSDTSIRFDLRVSKVLRGSVTETTSVFTENASSRVSWDVGREYVVFADRQGDRWVSWDDCGPLYDPAKLRERLVEIDALRRATNATIEGQVSFGSIGGSALSGVTVRVDGGGRTYQGISDRHGFFRIPVPPGRYQLRLTYGLVQSDLNNVKLNDIRLVRGQCAQVSLVQHEK